MWYMLIKLVQIVEQMETRSIWTLRQVVWLLGPVLWSAWSLWVSSKSGFSMIFCDSLILCGIVVYWSVREESSLMHQKVEHAPVVLLLASWSVRLMSLLPPLILFSFPLYPQFYYPKIFLLQPNILVIFIHFFFFFKKRSNLLHGNCWIQSINKT